MNIDKNILRSVHLQFPVFIFFIVLFSGIKAQNDSTRFLSSQWMHRPSQVYLVTPDKFLWIATPIISLNILSYYVDARPVSSIDLNALNIQDIPAFERNIIYFDSADARRASELSDIVNRSSMVIGFISIFSGYHEMQSLLNNGIIYVEALSANSIVTDLLKKSTGRLRPYVYNDQYPDEYRLRGAATSSFPSGHTSSTAFNCFFAAKMIDDYFIDDDAVLLRTVDWTIAAIIPAYCGYLRTAAGVHFITDVAAGYIIGAASGYFIPQFNKIRNENISLFPVVWPEGFGVGVDMGFSK